MDSRPDMPGEISPPASLRLSQGQFKRFCEIAYQRAGIHLNPGKETLVATRVAKRLRALKLRNMASYLELLQNDTDGSELVQFLDVISTNFTSFFREMDHFEHFGAQLDAWYAQGQRRFRIWSAASSTGEEPYSLAISILERFRDKPEPVDVRVLATDISTRVLARAEAGVYPVKGLHGINPMMRMRYFDERLDDEDEDGERRHFVVKQELRNLITFKRLNLSAPPFPMPGPLDVVFCRNVMIYFDLKVRQRLISEIERLLRGDGLLMIGHTETLTGVAHGLGIISPSIYRKPSVA